MKKRPVIAVIGGSEEGEALMKEAEQAGSLIAQRGDILVCGGLRGVMEAAAKGAHSAGGLTIGILPQEHKDKANKYIDIAVATGLGIGRNVIIARTADALIAVGGAYGTLSEIAFGLQLGRHQELGDHGCTTRICRSRCSGQDLQGPQINADCLSAT